MLSDIDREQQPFSSSLRYPNLSAGYIGQPAAHATLNAKFFYVHWRMRHGQTGTCVQLFPQRVPRTGFFEELIQVETDAFIAAFGAKRQQVRDEIETLSKVDLVRTGQVQHAINVMNTAARLGELAAIATLPNLDLCGDLESARYLSLKITFAISLQVSQGQPVDLAPLTDLCLRLDATPTLDEAGKAPVYNRLLVSAIRYAPSTLASDELMRIAGRVRCYLQSRIPRCLADGLTHSMMWRGIAMFPGYRPEEQRECLDSAWRVLDMSPATEPLHELLLDELRCTLLQTEAKWFMIHGTRDEVVAALQKMASLDPWDSTAYSELGLMLQRSGDETAALQAFRAAVDRGPPGLAMNLYFKGRCLLHVGQIAEAQASFEACCQIDPTALSPLLDLYRLHHQSQDMLAARLVRDRILSEPDLAEQLTPEERSELA